MTKDEFLASVQSNERPPESLSRGLQSLWHASKGDWEKAHIVAQDIPGPDGSWIHANLHREEGDLGNARYWYARAGKSESNAAIEVERLEIIETLLKKPERKARS